MNRPTRHAPRFGRPAALAVLAAVVIACAAIAVLPHLASAYLAAEIATRTEAAVAKEAEAMRMMSSQRRLAALSDAQIADNMFLQGATSGLNGAQLQKRVAGAASLVGINPKSLRVSDPEAWQHGLRRITVEIGLEAHLTVIQKFLYELETALPLMFVDNLTITRPDDAVEGTSPPMLDGNLTVRGVALAEAAK